jgi:hypothetical protein
MLDAGPHALLAWHSYIVTIDKRLLLLLLRGWGCMLPADAAHQPPLSGGAALARCWPAAAGRPAAAYYAS